MIKIKPCVTEKGKSYIIINNFINERKTREKNNSSQVLEKLGVLSKECDDKRAEQEYLVRHASELVELARLELGISVRVTEITARYQNLLGIVKVRTASATNAASILSELSESVDQFDIWLTDSTERFESCIGLDVPPGQITDRNPGLLFLGPFS